MKRRDFLSLSLASPAALLLPSLALAQATTDRIATLSKTEGCFGKALQDKAMRRAAGIAPQNRPYIFNGVQDCYGFVRQVWNAILSDGQEHSEDYYPKAYDRSRWLGLDGGMPVATAPDPAWRYVSDRNQLLPGDVLSTAQGHAWGADWHGGLYAGKDAAGNHMIWDNSLYSVNGTTGAYYHQYYDPFVWYYGPIHDLLAKQSGLNSSTWLNMPGTAQDIAIGGDNSLWVTGQNEGIYRWQGSDWQKLDGAACRIAVGNDGTAWVVNRDGVVHRRQGSLWTPMPGVQAQDIGIGKQGSVWVTAVDERIYQLQSSGNWLQVSGAARRVAVDPAGQPWVVNTDGNIYRMENNRWIQLTGRAKDIGVGINGAVWVIGMNDLPHQWTGNAWRAVDGLVSAIAVMPNGLPGVVGLDQKIYIRRS